VINNNSANILEFRCSKEQKTLAKKMKIAKRNIVLLVPDTITPIPTMSAKRKETYTGLINLSLLFISDKTFTFYPPQGFFGNY
jgi:hypothetical protein